MMEDEKPGCGVQANSNIMSRYKLLKSKFLAIQEVCGLSSSGWDENVKCVIMEDTMYADYVKEYKHYANLNRVPLPCCDGLEYMFDKVRATGSHVVGLEELTQTIPCPKIEVPSVMMLGWKKLNEPSENSTAGGQTEKEEYVVIHEDVSPTTTPTKKRKANVSDATSR